MKRFFPVLLCVFMFFLSGGFSFAEEDTNSQQKKIGISRSTERAIRKNLNLKLQKLDYDIKVIQEQKARVQFYPTVNMETVIENKDNNPFGKDRFNPADNLDNNNNTLTLKQPLYYFGQLKYGLEASIARKESGLFKVLEETLDLERQVVEAYLRVLSLTRQLSIRLESIKQANEQLALVEEEVKEKHRTRSAELRWKVLINDFEQDAVRLRHELINSRLRYNQLLELDPDEQLDLLPIGLEEFEADYLEYANARTKMSTRDIIREMFKYAVTMSPVSSRKNIDIEAARLELESEKTVNYPKIDFTPELSNDGGCPSYWYIGVTANFNIFNVSNLKDVELKKKSLEMTKVDKQIYLRDLRFSIENYFSQLSSSMGQVYLKVQQMEEGFEYLENTTKKYNKGQTDDVTLIDAYQTYYDNRITGVKVLYEFYIDRQNLRSTLGYSDFLQTPSLKRFMLEGGQAPIKQLVEDGGEIFKAVINNDDNVRKIVAANPALVNAKNAYGWTPLHWAAFKGRLDMVKYLVNQGAKVNDESTPGMTPLFLAATNGHDDIVKFLIHHGGNPNVVMGEFKWTPLMRACHKGYVNTVKELIQAGADVNAKSAIKWTPAHNAAESGSLDSFKLLVEHGANIKAENEMGDTPLDLAKLESRTDIVELIEKLNKEKEEKEKKKEDTKKKDKKKEDDKHKNQSKKEPKKPEKKKK